MNRPADEALAAFNEHVDQLAEEAGLELDADDRQRIFGLSVAGGFTEAATEEAFGELVYDDDDEFEPDDEPEQGPERFARHLTDDLARLSAEYGRPLTSREQEIIVHGSLAQAERFDRFDAELALDDHYESTRETRPDTNTEQGRHEFYRQRMADKEEPAEIDPDREFNLDNQDDRHAFMRARLGGAEFEDAEYAE